MGAKGTALRHPVVFTPGAFKRDHPQVKILGGLRCDARVSELSQFLYGIGPAGEQFPNDANDSA
jgi:hypothetical protein